MFFPVYNDEEREKNYTVGKVKNILKIHGIVFNYHWDIIYHQCILEVRKFFKKYQIYLTKIYTIRKFPAVFEYKLKTERKS